MRLVLSAQTDEQMQYAAQLGCDGVMSNLAPGGPDAGYMGYAALVRLRSKVESSVQM